MAIVPRLRAHPFFFLFLLCYTVVHAHFEYNFWVVGDAAIFAKYGAGDMVHVGERVYYAKAIWCFLLVWLLAVNVEPKTAMAWSFFAYAILLIALFPLRIYAVLNVLLAVGMLAERWAFRTSATAADRSGRTSSKS